MQCTLTASDTGDYFECYGNNIYDCILLCDICKTQHRSSLIWLKVARHLLNIVHIRYQNDNLSASSIALNSLFLKCRCANTK